MMMMMMTIAQFTLQIPYVLLISTVIVVYCLNIVHIAVMLAHNAHSLVKKRSHTGTADLTQVCLILPTAYNSNSVSSVN